MSAVFAWVYVGISLVVAITAAIRCSRAHDWLWLGAILGGWILLGGAGGLGWLLPAVYLFIKRQPRVSADA